VLEADPRYAPAWSQLAANFRLKASEAVLPNEQAYAELQAAANRALEIDPDYAPALALLGNIATVDDPAGAARLLERALALAPSDADVMRFSTRLLLALGRTSEALALADTAVRHDPLNPALLRIRGVAQFFAGQYDESIASVNAALTLDPELAQTHSQLGEAQLFRGNAAAAVAEFEREPSEVWRLLGLARAYHALGRKTDSDAALAELIAKHEKDWAYNIAYVCAFRGEADRAFAWLEKAVEYRDPGLADIASDRSFSNLHSDPRWLPFLRRIGKAPEQLAKIPFRVTIAD
jgi:tetratricopeptide (TPR) repeat protein